MFLGEYKHSIDEKGRLTIPAKFRSELDAGLVVTRGLDRNLLVFTMGEWEVLAQKIAEIPISDRSARAFSRRVFSGAVDLVPDKQGRILLPATLREFANLGDEAVIIGMYSYGEIWNAEAWNPVRDDIESNDDYERWENLGI